MDPSALEPVTMPDTEVEVWLARLDVDAEQVGQYANLLSVDEHERAQRFYFEHDRRRFMVARGALRTLLAERLGIPPRTIAFQYSDKGKPYLAGATLHFNISHSHERALIAISKTREVGSDIEYVHRKVDYELLAKRYFTPREYAALEKLPEAQRKRAFFTCWTCKEAVAKATGEGLFASLGKLEVAASPGLAIAKNIGDWALYGLKIDDNYVAAAAISTGS